MRWLALVVLVACGSSEEPAKKNPRPRLRRMKMPSSSMEPTIHVGEQFAIDPDRRVRRNDVVTFYAPCNQDREYAKRVVAMAGDTVEVRCGVLYVNGAAKAQTLLEAACSYDDVFEGERRKVTCSHYREGDHELYFDAERPRRDKLALDMHDFPRDQLAPSCGNAISDPSAQPNAKQAAGKIVTTAPDAEPCAPQRHFVVPEHSLFVLGDNRNNSNDSRYWGVVPEELVTGVVETD